MENKDKKKPKIEVKKELEKKDPRKLNPSKIESTPCKFWIDENGISQVIIDHEARDGGSLKGIYGTKDTEIAQNIQRSGMLAICSLVNGNNGLERSANSLNILFQSLHDYQPKDAIEARLVTQAVALFQNGMDQLARAGGSDTVSHSESHVNMGMKLIRLHNETIEALSRYRRGGEQKVTVVHVAEKMAVVNHFNSMGGGVSQENKGDKPCQQYAGQKQEPMGISHVDSQQWPTGDAAYMGENVQEQKQKKVCDA